MLRVFTFAALIISLLLSQTSFAQSYRLSKERAGKWETSLMWKFQDSESINFTNDNKLEFDSSDRWGFTIGYNLDNHINIHWAFSYLKPDYTATVAQSNLPTNLPEPIPDPAVISHRASMTTNQFNFTYNLLKGDITPFVSAGLGWTNIDSNIASSTGIVCSPWYPYWCGTYTNTFNDTKFSYNWGLGLRWDINRDIFIRAGVGEQYVDLSKTKSTPSFESGQFEIGFRL